jgi:hypothetical protein
MTNSTLGESDRAKIAAYLKGRNIPVGLGTRESACSIAAINMALSGQLTDAIPECMSPVIGRWIITIQDAMPDGMRNGAEWRTLLPLAAGTGRDHESARLDMIMDWTWTVVLPSLQALAGQSGLGVSWRVMCEQRTKAAARMAAAWAAEAAARAEAAAWEAAWEAAAWQALVVPAAVVEPPPMPAAVAVAAALAAAAWEAAEAWEAAVAATAPEAWEAAELAAWEAKTWQAFNPPALLAKLIELDNSITRIRA